MKLLPVIPRLKKSVRLFTVADTLAPPKLVTLPCKPQRLRSTVVAEVAVNMPLLFQVPLPAMCTVAKNVQPHAGESLPTHVWLPVTKDVLRNLSISIAPQTL